MSASRHQEYLECEPPKLGIWFPKLHPLAPPKCSWKDWPMMRVDIIKHFGMFLGYHRWFLAELECNSGMCAPIPFTPVLCWAGSCNFITQCAAGGMLRWGACRNTWCQHWFHNRHLWSIFIIIIYLLKVNCEYIRYGPDMGMGYIYIYIYIYIYVYIYIYLDIFLASVQSHAVSSG